MIAAVHQAARIAYQARLIMAITASGETARKGWRSRATKRQHEPIGDTHAEWSAREERKNIKKTRTSDSQLAQPASWLAQAASWLTWKFYF